MSISVDPATSVISVPQADLTLITGTLYEHDTEAFRLELIDFEDSELGIVQPQTHLHNSEVTIVGVTYARFIEMLAPYSVEYEDGAYSVRLTGSNNNIFDVEAGILVQNTVQLIANNSAGLIVVTNDPGLIWDELLADHVLAGSFGEWVGKKLLSVVKFLGLK